MEAKKLTRVALEATLLYVVQVALAFIPNCELVTTMIIVFTLCFGKEVILATFVFALVEGATYGFGLWVIIYFYIWPILVLLVLFFKKIIKNNWVLWAVFSGFYGLCFGALCAIEYIPIDISYVITYWISGIPWDVWHGFINFCMTLFTGNILYRVVLKVSNK